MLKKILTAFLAVMVLTVALNTSVLARANDGGDKKNGANREKTAEKADLKAVIKSKSDSSNPEFTEKSTMAEYERAKKQGGKFSTTTKVLIGVGIAAAILTVVVVAASRDKIRTF